VRPLPEAGPVSPRATRADALLAALDWVGAYEAMDPRRPGEFASLTLAEAFETAGRAGEVKRRFGEFPEDLVDAYAMLRRMYLATVRAAGPNG
jgi:hypothetical protein